MGLGEGLRIFAVSPCRRFVGVVKKTVDGWLTPRSLEVQDADSLGFVVEAAIAKRPVPRW